ncbi:DUF4184 family protein [Priestia koreensis]|uniref:DUF4184 family protein n=1 Tax=Priestia koreensis TaxID=284581 RepID=UPI00203F8744|nr:DUF4184 family protein [Priestia koreensis]MCM3006465.1 DUF4184 family protein [Priestia koreensis]
MPLTFAHPAVILPFSKKSTYVHFSAMILGSMAPDFEYFLRGQPGGEIGHTFSGFFYYNLPFVILIYFIYRFLIQHTLLHYFPLFPQDTYTTKRNISRVWKLVIFSYSALFGMLTHIVWDSFTHLNGYMVLKFPTVFARTYNIYGYTIPLYKFLQHGSTLLGITAIIIYMYVRSLSQQRKNVHIPMRSTFMFWSSFVLLMLVVATIWQLIDYAPLLNYGAIVVRIIDSGFISLLFLSLVLTYTKHKIS